MLMSLFLSWLDVEAGKVRDAAREFSPAVLSFEQFGKRKEAL